jgi:hypothetical protein
VRACTFGCAFTGGEKENDIGMGKTVRGINDGGVAEKEDHKNIKIETHKRSIVEEVGRRNNACPMRNGLLEHEQRGKSGARGRRSPLLVRRALKCEDY